MSDIFLTAAWRHLLVLNYEIDARLLAPRLPPGTSLDLDNGRCFASIVAFRFEGTRVLGRRVPCHVLFPEINLRFYVTLQTADGPQRGVVFLREFVNRPFVAAIARRCYNEAYKTVPMRYDLDLADGSIAPASRVAYRWRVARKWHEASGVAAGDWRSVLDDDHVAFIAEHYYGFGQSRDGRTIEYRVAHPPWRFCPVEQPRFACDVAAVYGRDFAGALGASPYSAFLIDGSEVVVHRPRFLGGKEWQSCDVPPVIHAPNTNSRPMAGLP